LGGQPAVGVKGLNQNNLNYNALSLYMAITYRLLRNEAGFHAVTSEDYSTVLWWDTQQTVSKY